MQPPLDPQLAVTHGNDGVEVAMVFKAQPTGTEPVPHLCIAATVTLPDVPRALPLAETLSFVRDVHVRDAAVVVDALVASLPGGTVDQILRLLLERKATHLVVRW